MSKSGKPRKSRRLRLNISIGWGGDHEFAPTVEDWQRIEGAYSDTLNSDDRASVVILVNNYFRWQPSEARAPFADDAIQYLDRLERAHKQLWSVLLETQQTPMSGTGDHAHIAERDRIRGVAIGFVQSHVGRYLKQFEFRAHTDWRGLLNVMGACAAALLKAREYINDQAIRVGFVEGRAWDQLIWKLTEFANERSLPSGVSKFDEPSQASPFVRFVRELQRTFPDQFRRHETSNAALTEAITVARRQIRRAIENREAQKNNSPMRSD